MGLNNDLKKESIDMNPTMEVFENDNYTIDPSKYTYIKCEPGRDYDREMMDKLREIKRRAKEKNNTATDQ